jgi:hypothetical protein
MEEFQRAYGYPALTPEIKAKIFGGNLAKVYGIDPQAKRCAISQDQLATARRYLRDELGPTRFTQNEPFGPRTRREFLAYRRSTRGLPG